MKTWLLVSLLLLLVLVLNAIAFSNPTRNGDDVTLPPCNFPNGIYYQNGPNPGTPVAPVNQNYTLAVNRYTEGQYTCGPSGSGGQITLHRQFKENKTLVPKNLTWGQREVLDCTGYVPGNYHSGYKVTWLLDGRQLCIKNSACEDNFYINPDNFSLSFDYYPTFTTYECQIEPDVPGSSTNVATVASYTLSLSNNDHTQTKFIKNLKPVLVENGTNKVEFSCSASVQSNASIDFIVSDLFGNNSISPADCDVTTTDNPTIRMCSKTLLGMNIKIMCNYSTSYEIHCIFTWNLTNINQNRVYLVACHVNDGTTKNSTRTELIVRADAIAFSNPTRHGNEVTLSLCIFPDGIYYQNGPDPGIPVAPVNQNYTLTINGSTEGRYRCGSSGIGGTIIVLRKSQA
ncbi:PREDICTED: uncharacterized protein LOC109588760, partial [Amphimedon queenslandica]|uniref:Ig-like domain-containing protein n=2 Tax=Amphimedon queenslandica TaxID=400682 RepID=A0AAN0JUA4_AMPQE